MANFSTVGFNLKMVASICVTFLKPNSAVITDVAFSRSLLRMF